jgi:hypothetical protein
LGDDFEWNIKKIRVYIHPIVIERMAQADAIENVRDAVWEFLENKYKRSVLV